MQFNVNAKGNFFQDIFTRIFNEALKFLMYKLKSNLKNNYGSAAIPLQRETDHLKALREKYNVLHLTGDRLKN